MDKTVYIVHCIDTEGPLYESPEVPFTQIKKIFDIEIEPTRENFSKLMNREIDLQGKDEAIYNLIDPHKAAINGDWGELKEYMLKATSDKFRNEMADSNGHGWVYNWFCLDHVGFTGENPRRRDPGHHKVFDFYTKNLKVQNNGDMIQIHHHPISHSGDFHSCGTAFWGRNTLDDILTHKIIDRQWFPSAYRPGFHTERPDSNWFLEQWIPFDYANQSVKGLDTNQPDLVEGRFGDWRRAPQSWIPYHPDHDDYQKEGNCRRWIARCLNMYARLREITQEDVYDAFEEALKNGKSILSFTDHDFKDMCFDINRMRTLIRNASEKYSEVKFVYSNAVDAMRACCDIKKEEINMQCVVEVKGTKKLVVKTSNKVFGPQPYLAIKTKDGRYIWDNFDFQGINEWSYTFDRDSIEYDLVEELGVAANNAYGKTEIMNYKTDHSKWKKTILN